MRKGLWGIPVFEVAVVISIAGVTGYVLLQYAEEVLERAESVAVETTVMNIRTGLRLEMARRIVAGQGVRELRGSNPLLLLQGPPVGFLPQDMKILTKTAKSGGWSYAPGEHILYYQPKRYRHLAIDGLEGPPVLAWKLEGGRPEVGEVGLLAVNAYRWFDVARF